MKQLILRAKKYLNKTIYYLESIVQKGDIEDDVRNRITAG